jgi:hypothetical protein
MSLGTVYLDSVQKRLLYYKMLGDKTLDQLTGEQLHWQPPGDPNSIYLVIKHIHGNMLSRWTDFLTSDGEKPTRNRDREFEEDTATKAQVLAMWTAGWDCMMQAIGSLTETDLEKTVYIRSEPHSVVDAINRQVSHIPYHVGQIVYIGKMIQGNNWESLSIPRGQSQQYNQQKFGK